MMFCFSCGHANEEGRQQGEDVCLKEGYQQLDAVHEQHEEDGNRRNSYRLEDEDERYQAQDNDVSCGDIRKETYHQGKRL